MIRSFRSRALRLFWTKGEVTGLRPDWIRKIDRQLSLLDQAVKPDDMNVVTYGFHALTRDQAGRCSITVSRNWRITFRFDGEDAEAVDLEDDHG